MSAPPGLSSFLVTSPSGHVLIDTGLPEANPLIKANIEKLGFKLADIKYLLNTPCAPGSHRRPGRAEEGHRRADGGERRRQAAAGRRLLSRTGRHRSAEVSAGEGRPRHRPGRQDHDPRPGRQGQGEARPDADRPHDAGPFAGLHHLDHGRAREEVEPHGGVLLQRHGGAEQAGRQTHLPGHRRRLQEDLPGFERDHRRRVPRAAPGNVQDGGQARR